MSYRVKMMSKLYYIIYILIHYIYTCIEFIYKTWVYLKTNWYFNHEGCGNFKNDIELIKFNLNKVDKIPKHIAIILGNDKPSYKDLTNLIIWCISSGITFISFYDHNGILKKTETELYNSLWKRRKDSMDNIMWCNNYDHATNNSSTTSNGYKNGVHKKIHINIYSIEDGRNSIAKITKQLVKCTEYNKSDEIDVNYLDNYIFTIYNKLPEPDLALCCGDTCSTYGFLPWHIRLTEFINIKSHHDIKVHTFIDCLFKFARCEQRFGK